MAQPLDMGRDERNQLIEMVQAAEQRAGNAEAQLRRYEESVQYAKQGAVSTPPQYEGPTTAPPFPGSLGQAVGLRDPRVSNQLLASQEKSWQDEAVPSRGPRFQIWVQLTRGPEVRFSAMLSDWFQAIEAVSQYVKMAGFDITDKLSVVGFVEPGKSGQRSIDLREETPEERR